MVNLYHYFTDFLYYSEKNSIINTINLAVLASRGLTLLLFNEKIMGELTLAAEIFYKIMADFVKRRRNVVQYCFVQLRTHIPQSGGSKLTF